MAIMRFVAPKRVCAAVACVALLGSVLGACGTSSSSSAQGGSASVKLPASIEIVVPFKPGGTADISARLLQPYFQKALGVPVEVQNMTGGTGNTGLSYVAHHKPDGSVLGIDILPAEMLVQSLEKTGFNEHTLTPIVNIAGGNDEVLGVLKSSPYKTLHSLANHKGAPLRIGVAGYASNGELVFALLHSTTAFKNIVLIPYQGGGPVMTALVGKQVDVAVAGSAPFAKFVATGRGRALVTFGASRSPFLPNVPTAAQQGFGQLTMSVNTALVGPPGMAPALVKRLSAAALKAMKNPAFAAGAKKASLAVQPAGPSTVTKILSRDQTLVTRGVPLVRKLGKG